MLKEKVSSTSLIYMSRQTSRLGKRTISIHTTPPHRKVSLKGYSCASNSLLAIKLERRTVSI